MFRTGREIAPFSAGEKRIRVQNAGIYTQALHSIHCEGNEYRLVESKPGLRFHTEHRELLRVACESQNRRDENDARATVRPMSVRQIIDELPKLTPADLLAVRRKLIEISEENEGVSLCDAAALEGAQLLDQMEAGDGAR